MVKKYNVPQSIRLLPINLHQPPYNMADSEIEATQLEGYPSTAVLGIVVVIKKKGKKNVRG